MTWDKKKTFVQGDGVGTDNIKLVKTESHIELLVTYHSRRFKEWKSKKNMRGLPQVGEIESSKMGWVGKRYSHNKVMEPKQLDRHIRTTTGR